MPAETEKEICRQSGKFVPTALDVAVCWVHATQESRLRQSKSPQSGRAVITRGLGQPRRIPAHSGSVRQFVGKYDAHVKLEAVLWRQEKGAILFGEKEAGHVVTCTGVERHVMLQSKPCPGAMPQGREPAAQSP